MIESIVIVSGGFDPLTSGHIDYLKDAGTLGLVYVLLNSDEWLIRKKGKYFMSFGERAVILESIRVVEDVYDVDDSDNTVSRGLVAMTKLFPHDKIIFANGGDRIIKNTPEIKLCKKLGIETAFNVGGGKTQSSSKLLKQWSNYE